MNRSRLFFLALFLVVFTCFKAEAQLNKRYYYYVGQGLIIDEKYQEAIDVLSVLLRVDSTAYDGFFLRGVAKYNLGDYVGSESDFSTAIKINPVYTMAYQYRAISRSYLGNYDDAINDFDMAIDIRPDNEGIYYTRGITYFMSQQFDKAIVDFDYFIKKRPHVVDAYINRGSSYLMKQDTLSAFRDYDQAVKINRYDANGYARRGGVYLSMQKYDSAYIDLSRSIELDSTSVAAYFNRAVVGSYKNRPLDAIADFTKVIELDSMNSLTYFNRALVFSQIGDYQKSLQDYQKVEEYSPSNVLLYYNRGGLNMQLGNLVAAERDFTKAIDLYPDFANAYLNRSSARFFMGDMQGSKTDKLIAEAKISAYRAKLKDSTFSQYADTSKLFSRLVSFDADFGNKEFENVKRNDIDIKLLPMFRVTLASRGSTERILQYENDDIKGFLLDNGINGDAFTLALELRDEEALKVLDEKFGEMLKKRDEWQNYFARGVTQNAMRQYSNAIALYSSAIDKAPDNAFLYINRASARADMIDFVVKMEKQSGRMVIDAEPVNRLRGGKQVYNYNEAIVDLRKAIKLKPDVAQFYYNLGNLLCLNGEHADAIEVYTKAIELNPYIGEAYFNRGIIQLHLKDTRKGCLDISKAGELGVIGAYEILARFK